MTTGLGIMESPPFGRIGSQEWPQGMDDFGGNRLEQIPYVNGSMYSRSGVHAANIVPQAHPAPRQSAMQRKSTMPQVTMASSADTSFSQSDDTQLVLPDGERNSEALSPYHSVIDHPPAMQTFSGYVSLHGGQHYQPYSPISLVPTEQDGQTYRRNDLVQPMEANDDGLTKSYALSGKSRTDVQSYKQNRDIWDPYVDTQSLLWTDPRGQVSRDPLDQPAVSQGQSVMFDNLFNTYTSQRDLYSGSISPSPRYYKRSQQASPILIVSRESGERPLLGPILEPHAAPRMSLLPGGQINHISSPTSEVEAHVPSTPKRPRRNAKTKPRNLTPAGKEHANKVRKARACRSCHTRHSKCKHVLPEDIEQQPNYQP